MWYNVNESRSGFKMLIRDYNEKMAMALDFYDQAVEILSMVHDGISGFHYLYNFNIIDGQLTDSKRKQYIIGFEEKINKRKKQLLIELGRVGEYAIKYILLLKQMNDYPNQTFEEFKLKAMYSLADRGVANTYINQYHMNQTLVDSIRLAKDQHQLQPLHDYDYLFTMLKILHPDLVNDIHKIIELKIKQYILMDSNLPDDLKAHYSHFPDRMILGLTDLSESELQQYRDEFERIIRDSGDAFARLRYLKNNPNNKQYDLKATLDMLDYLVDYIRLVHDINHDDINLDITTAYRKERIINEKVIEISRSAPRDDYYDYCQSKLLEEKSHIEEIFNIERVANNSDLQYAIFFKSFLSVEEVNKLVVMNYSDDELYALISNNITEEFIKFFNANNVCNIQEIIRIINNNTLSLNEFKNLNFNKDQIYLLTWLDVDTIKKLNKDTKVYEYIINNRNVLSLFFKNYKSSKEDYELFSEIIMLDEIETNPSLLNLLDYNQFSILNQLNIKKPSNYEVILNIKENINEYKNKGILKKIPIMLNSLSIKKVYQLIIDNGFNDSMIENLDSTIFCIPYEIVSAIINVMKEKNISFIDNGNINSMFYNILESIRSRDITGVNENKPLPLRHLGTKYDSGIENNDYSVKEPIDLNVNLKTR